MKKFRNFTRLLAAVVIVCSALIVMAHDAWVMPGSGPVYAILYGHKIPEKYDAVKVTSLKVFDAAQKPLTFKQMKTAQGIAVKVNAGKPALFALEFDNGYWVKVAGESKNVRKSEMPEGTDPVHPLKFSKTIISWQPWMNKPLGQRIEFVPVDAVAAPKAGAKMRLQLLLDGKPLSGQMVENNSNEMGPKTDANGYVTVTVLKGANRFATDHDINQPDDTDAQRLSLTAALVFTVN